MQFRRASFFFSIKHLTGFGLAQQMTLAEIGFMFFIMQTVHLVHWQPHLWKQPLMTEVSTGHESISGKFLRLLKSKRAAQVSILPPLAMHK